MCGPEAIVLATASLITAATTFKEVSEKKAESEYQADLLIKQADKSKNDAAYERQEGIEEARRKKLQSIIKMENEKANMASGNISLNSQTALNIIDNEKLNGELDALVTLKDSEHRAEQYIYQSKKYYANAGLKSFQTQNNYINSNLKTTANLLSANAKNVD